MAKTQILAFVLFFIVPTAAIAQDPDQKDEAAENQRKVAILLNQVIADIPSLKLGENRAFVYATLGNIAWKTDPAAGRELFVNAVSELLAAQALAESQKRSPHNQNELLTSGSTRPQTLSIIARRDAELALDALVKSRPTAIVDALKHQSGNNQKISNYTNNNYLAQNELNLEQSFVRLAAEQGPERAAKLLRDSLKKGVSNETLNLLKKLHEKDPAAASSLGSEIADKLIKSRLMTAGDVPDNAAINSATAFLTDFIRQRGPNDKSFIFGESQMRALADRLIGFYLDQGSSRGYYAGSILQIAEKFSPASLERLKQIQRNYQGFDFGRGYDPDVQKLLTSETAPEQLLAEAKRFPANQRGQIYQTAANKYAQIGNFAAAKQVLLDNFSDGPLDGALHSLEWQYASNLLNAGRFAEAELLIDEMPEINRISALTNLANVAFSRDPEANRTYAVGLLGKARSLIGERPENANEMSNLLQIATSFVRIDHNRSIAMLESVVPQINEITDAAIVFMQFQGNSSIRNGETLMSQGNSFGVHVDYSIFQMLAKKDFERTVDLIGSFSRIETRTRLRLQLAESGLN